MIVIQIKMIQIQMILIQVKALDTDVQYRN